MVKALRKPWPKNFPFQDYIDGNPSIALRYGLPTREQLEQLEQADDLPVRPSLRLEADVPE
jgi:hypothetical protein